MLGSYHKSLKTLGFAGGGGSDSWGGTSWDSHRSYDIGWNNKSSRLNSSQSEALGIFSKLIALIVIILSLWA